MIAPRLIPVVVKQLLRHRTRTLLTVSGVATAMFLFCAVEALQRGVSDATRASSGDATLIVYRENRYCPFTSRLPDYYLGRIERVEGVRSVVPMRVVVNNCRASLDVVTLRGVPEDRFAWKADSLNFISGSLDEWRRRSDAALLGEDLARRRGLTTGEVLDAAGVRVYVAGVFRAAEVQDRNSAYVHLDFLQRTVRGSGDGIVTQFNVKVEDPSMLESVARAIDAEFASDPEPTFTQPEQAFVARAAADVIDLVRFTRWLGWGCLAAVLALVGNAIALSVEDRVKEHAILQTLGYRSSLIARLIVTEGLLLSLAGGLVGAVLSAGALRIGSFGLTIEGVTLGASGGVSVALLGLIVAGAVGVLAGLFPAWRASRQDIAACFRAV